MSLGTKIKQLRQEKGWSKGELAYHATIDGRQISRYENDKVTPSVEVVVKLAMAAKLFEMGRLTSGQATWVKVEPLTGPLDPLLDNVLDTGEASVIQLAREKHIDRILIDECKGQSFPAAAVRLACICR